MYATPESIKSAIKAFAWAEEQGAKVTDLRSEFMDAMAIHIKLKYKKQEA